MSLFVSLFLRFKYFHFIAASQGGKSAQMHVTFIEYDYIVHQRTKHIKEGKNSMNCQFCFFFFSLFPVFSISSHMLSIHVLRKQTIFFSVLPFFFRSVTAVSLSSVHNILRKEWFVLSLVVRFLFIK